jgi:hypothetical protein
MVEELTPIGQDRRHRGIGSWYLGRRRVDHEIAKRVKLVGCSGCFR